MTIQAVYRRYSALVDREHELTLAEHAEMARLAKLLNDDVQHEQDKLIADYNS
mgnify:CR=1 FL=1